MAKKAYKLTPQNVARVLKSAGYWRSAMWSLAKDQVIVMAGAETEECIAVCREHGWQADKADATTLYVTADA